MNVKVRVTRYIAAIAGICLLLAGAGFYAGRVLGDRFVEDIVLGEGRLPLLLSRPVNRFYEVYTLIHSENRLSRLAGYYGLADNGIINLEFLAERFRLEQDPPLQAAIVWVAARSGDTDGVLRFYSSVFSDSSDSVKKRILGLMKGLNNDYFMKFIRDNRIDPGAMPEDGREINVDILW